MAAPLARTIGKFFEVDHVLRRNETEILQE
jgi:galactose-1-phosphate uridylyltransferase